MQRPAKPWTSVRFRAQPPYQSLRYRKKILKNRCQVRFVGSRRNPPRSKVSDGVGTMRKDVANQPSDEVDNFQCAQNLAVAMATPSRLGKPLPSRRSRNRTGTSPLIHLFPTEHSRKPRIPKSSTYRKNKNPGKPSAEIRAYPVWVLLLRASIFYGKLPL